MTLLIGLLLVFLLIGLPVFAALGLSSLIFVIVERIPILAAGQQLFEGLNSFPLLAVPFFVLAACLMNSSGITDRLFAFARNLVGHIAGGLGHVNILASMIFSGMSGTALGDAAGLGTIEIKAMRAQGYDTKFAVGVTAASSTIGPLIPPSLPMVIYGVVAGASIGQLFIAGIVPGLLVALSLHIMVYVMAKMRGYPREPRASLPAIGRSFIASLPVLFAPVIIIGGIMGGVFTPTEAAVVACLYALFIGFFVHRSLGLRTALVQFREAFETTATMMVMLGGASLFGWLLVRQGAAGSFSEFALSYADGPLALLVIVNLALLFCGMFMDPIPIILVATPILLPALDAFGIDRVHFGVLMIINLMVGMMTPPIGVLTFVMARIAGLDLLAAVRACLPFMVPIVIVLVLVSAFPALSLWLPGLLFETR